MSIQKKVSIRRAVQQALDNLALESTAMVPKFMVWAAEAENRIGSYTQYKRKIHVLDINQCSVELPCSVKAVLGLLIGDHGCDCGLLFRNVYTYASSQPRATPTMGFLVVDGGQISVNSNLNWKIHDNHIVFNNNYQSGKITVETLDYETDQDGFPLINENHVYAIAQFIEWMYMKHCRHKIGGVNYSRGEIQDAFMQWSRLAAHAHAEDGDPTPAQIAGIAVLFNDPLSGLGNAIWTYADPYYGLRSIV